VPLSTLRQPPCGGLRMTRGPCDALLLHGETLSFSIPRQFRWRTKGRIRPRESTEHKGRIGTWYENTNKHLWPDLEIWETNGSQGYGGSYRSNICVDCAAYADFKRQRGNRHD
jgi:hypothetical protein